MQSGLMSPTKLTSDWTTARSLLLSLTSDVAVRFLSPDVVFTNLLLRDRFAESDEEQDEVLIAICDFGLLNSKRVEVRSGGGFEVSQS